MPASVRARVVIGWSVLWLAGCGLYGPCDHGRGIGLYATAHGGDVRQVDQTAPLSTVAFWEHQRDGSQRHVTWNILAPRLPGRARLVQLYEGSAATGGGTLLYTFPIENARRDVQQAGLESDSIIDLITSGSVETPGADSSGRWYRATVPIEDLMQRMFRGPTYIEVRTDSVPTGAFRAPLGTPRFFHSPGRSGEVAPGALQLIGWDATPSHLHKDTAE